MGKERIQKPFPFFYFVKRTSFKELLQIYTKDLKLTSFSLTIFKLFEIIFESITPS